MPQQNEIRRRVDEIYSHSPIGELKQAPLFLGEERGKFNSRAAYHEEPL